MVIIMMSRSLNERPLARRTLEITSLPSPLVPGEAAPTMEANPAGGLPQAGPEPLLHPEPQGFRSRDI